ncbi:MAG: hypothetical protein GF331_20385 [Chitinivibrionales bacterium]|nr:hypothetical protein [Chitinivibrionales bacterium]
MNERRRTATTDRTGDTMQSFMSLMVVLIPLLLVSAEFARISIVELSTSSRGVRSDIADRKRPQRDSTRRLDLTVIVTDSAFTIGAGGGFLPSIGYWQYLEYAGKDGSRFRVPLIGGQASTHPQAGAHLDARDRTDIALLVIDSAGSHLQCLHTPAGEALTDRAGRYVARASTGDTLLVIGDNERPFIVTSLRRPKLAPLSAFDMLSHRLMRIRARYSSAPDCDEIIIAADDEVLYDKLIGVLDAVRVARFEGISIGRLRES